MPLACRALILGLSALGACTASAGDVAPPQYQLYFPTGLALSPDQRYLFVVSANSDLRYSSGAVHVIDLERVDAIAAAHARHETVGGCKLVPTRLQVLGCPMVDSAGAPASFMLRGGSVGIGNFGVAVDVQQLSDSPGMRVFASVRGDPSVTWMDFDPQAQALSCGGSGELQRCGDTHRLARLRNDLAFASLPPEPFGLKVVDDHVFVTHFTTGYVSLVSAPPLLGVAPMLQDTITTLWVPSRLTGGFGAVGLAARPGDPSGLVYVTSREEARVASVGVAQGNPDIAGRPTESLVRSQSFFLSGVEQPGLPADARGIAFSADGNRVFISSRTPPSLEVYDTSLDARGAPRNFAVGKMEVCEQPANLAVVDFGAGMQVALPCFVSGQVWFIDGETLQLLAVEDSGRGPTGIVASRLRNKIYVGNYAEDTITVFDAVPGSQTQNRAVVRLGTPRPNEGN